MKVEEYGLGILKEPLLMWFENHARVLPWREDVTPYRVWVSEIMLQQTRVEAVKPYFERFLKELPSVESLAGCQEDTLLKLWEGLGYYNRVRNMQAAARQVMEDYGGKIPSEYKELLKLKGIGHYTAGAIASIAYGVAVAAVDGNVLRVISRVTGDDRDIMKQQVRTNMEIELKKIIPRDRAGAFNQALHKAALAPVPLHKKLQTLYPYTQARSEIHTSPPKVRVPAVYGLITFPHPGSKALSSSPACALPACFLPEARL